MIAVSELKSIARDRFKDAQVLAANQRYDGAVYLCGYVVEMALKAQICKTLKWDGFPETRSEWEGKSSLKVHDFEQLLNFTGVGAKIKPGYLAEWDVVRTWQPEFRYRPSGFITKANADEMIAASITIMKALK